MSAVSDARWPVSRWVSRRGVGWGGEVSTECLCAVVLWVSSGSPTAQHLLLGSTPSVWQRKAAPSRTGQSRLSAPRNISQQGGPPPPDPAGVSPSPPSLSPLTQRSL
ncbi:hypothetical protein PBY51_020168 [Eleginops maclovinus]|uniref:Uncharacterized protein n=1 Tax=Eleginops maclovinus TaxID=56733 RepID=A0AAN7XLZ6_ELEMC|nr:hypothetical protein PBY51_020168 [Eleginops maclovinus]